MGRPKFKKGDHVRIGGSRPLPAAYPWVRRGRLCTITEVQQILYPSGRSRFMYWLTPRKGRPPIRLESYHLRHPDERDRRPRGN